MSMPIPKSSARIAFAGDTCPLPAPVTHAGIDLGYIEIVEDSHMGETCTQDATFTYIQVTHALVDRTFVYRVLLKTVFPSSSGGGGTVESYDVRALFVPHNEFRPKYNRGTWYYGRDEVVNYIVTTKTKPKQTQCVLFVSKSAEVRWQVEGVSGAQQLHHVLRPQVSPRDATPIEFRGMYDCCVPDCCDA